MKTNVNAFKIKIKNSCYDIYGSTKNQGGGSVINGATLSSF